MKDLKVRAISGILYVILLVSTMYAGPLAFFIVLGVFSLLALIEFQKLIGDKNPIPILCLLALYFIHYTQPLSDSILLGLLLLAILSSLGLSYRLYFPFSLTNPLIKLTFAIGYLVTCSVFIVVLYGSKELYAKDTILFTYILVWMNNSAAYFVGSRFGKTPLFPSISPKKSWEGFWGGLVFCLLFAIVCTTAIPSLPVVFGIVMGISIPALATVGDLIQSQFKRLAGVKDSGRLIPGHGGFYDRMDSIIYAAPFVYLIQQIISHVS